MPIKNSHLKKIRSFEKTKGKSHLKIYYVPSQHKLEAEIKN